MRGKKIILGITGSIAAYKAVYLIRALVKDGAEVQVVMTPAAKKLLKIHNLNEQFKDFSKSLADFFKSLSIPILDIKNNRSFEFYSKIIETININKTKSDISLLKLINMNETTYFKIGRAHV